MQIVRALADAKVTTADATPAYALRANRRYMLHDHEAGLALRQGAVEVEPGVKPGAARYHCQPLDTHRLILPFIGGRGDAVVVSRCLQTLRDANPEVTLDVAAPDSVRSVFSLFTATDTLRPYPLEASELANYDYYLSLEDVEAVPNATARSCADVFHRCLGAPRPVRHPEVIASAAFALPASDRRRVAVHLGRAGSLRTSPDDLSEELARRLSAKGYEVYLIGAPDAPMHDWSNGMSHVHDLVGRTPSPADLAAVLKQMNGVVTGDSFPMHLSGVMGIPTVAIFTATDAVLASDYSRVDAVASGESCSPCRVAEGVCPLGHGECIAHRSPAVAPSVLAERLEAATKVTIPQSVVR